MTVTKEQIADAAIAAAVATEELGKAYGTPGEVDAVLAHQGATARKTILIAEYRRQPAEPKEADDGRAAAEVLAEQAAKAAAFDAALAAFTDPLENDRWVAAGLSALLAAERAKRGSEVPSGE